jgi:aldehyde:ferredoxin oxidoreductase
VDDIEAVAFANELCNMYGMDTISCGATIAWAMDAFEHGYITKDDTDGVCLTFGNAEAMVQMVEKIAKKEGFGAILAEGSARAAETFGPKAVDLVVAVKNQEMPAHMPQVKRSLGLIYAVNPYGADHQSSEHDPSWKWYPERMAMLGLGEAQPNKVLNKEKVNFALTTEKLYMALNSFNICQFVFGPSWHLYGPDQLAELVQLTLGWDIGIEGIQEIGERVLNMLRAFNAREGFTREDDTLPKKLYKPLKGGRSEGIALTPEELEQAKDWYYEMAGWDQNGVPTREKLTELGLGWIEI